MSGRLGPEEAGAAGGWSLVQAGNSGWEIQAGPEVSPPDHNREEGAFPSLRGTDQGTYRGKRIAPRLHSSNGATYSGAQGLQTARWVEM